MHYMLRVNLKFMEDSNVLLLFLLSQVGEYMPQLSSHPPRSCHTSEVLVAMRDRSYDELLPQNPSPLALKRKLCPGFWCFCLIPMNKLLLDFFKGKIDPPPPCAPLVPATPVLPFLAL